MGNEVPPPGYAANAKPDVEAKGDATNIRTVLERDGATAAADRLRQEVDAVPAAQRDAYNAALLKELQGDGRNKTNVLPELAIAFGLQNKANTIDSNFRWGDSVSQDKINKAIAGEKNPVYQELYRQFGDKYKQIKAENAGQSGFSDTYGQSLSPFETMVPEKQLRERLQQANDKAVRQTDVRNKFGELVTNPKLFDGIAGPDGNITRDKVTAFQEKWNAAGETGAAFRRQFAQTPEQERKVNQTVEDLKNAYDDPRHKNNADGAIFKDNRVTTLGIEMGSAYGTMTRDTLLKGMGYKDMNEAKARLPVDAPATNAPIKPIAEVNSVTDYNSTAQAKGDGPAQVANRMLRGDRTQDQTRFFTKPEEAQRMLTDVLKQPDIWKFDQQGKPHVTAENRDQVLAAIKAAEAKKAADTRQPENSELSNWFASRYPKLDSTAPATPDVQPAADFGASKIIRGQGSDAISRKLVEGQNLDDGARRALQKVINDKAVTGVDLASARTGTEVINATNLEKVREAVEKANNPQLTAWFNKRYPKR